MPKGAIITFVAWCAFMGAWFVLWRIAENMQSFVDPYQWDDDERDTYSYGGDYGEDMPDDENDGD